MCSFQEDYRSNMLKSSSTIILCKFFNVMCFIPSVYLMIIYGNTFCHGSLMHNPKLPVINMSLFKSTLSKFWDLGFKKWGDCWKQKEYRAHGINMISGWSITFVHSWSHTRNAFQTMLRYLLSVKFRSQMLKYA